MTRYERIKDTLLVVLVGFPLAALLDVLARISEWRMRR
jgi:hypothetical protein